MKTIPRGNPYWTVLESLRNLVGTLTPNRRIRAVNGGTFEAELCELLETQEIAFTSRARVAFQLLLESSGARKSAKIIMSPITIRPMLDVVVGLGLEPIFVDLNPSNLLPSEDGLRRALLEEPSFCLFTPLFGLSGDLESLVKMVSSRDCVVLADISQCLHTTYQGAPMWKGCDLVFGSFSALKTVDTLGGGFAFQPEKPLPRGVSARVEHLKNPSRRMLFFAGLRNLAYAVYASPLSGAFVSVLRFLDGIKPGFALRSTGSRSPRVRHGLPDDIMRKFSIFQASLGRSALSKSYRRVSRRRRNAKVVRAGAANSSGMFRVPQGIDVDGSDYWQVFVETQNPLAVQRALWKEKIDVGATSLSFLPECEGLQSSFECPVARQLYFQSLFLPSHPWLKRAEVERVARAVIELSGHATP